MTGRACVNESRHFWFSVAPNDFLLIDIAIGGLAQWLVGILLDQKNNHSKE